MRDICDKADNRDVIDIYEGLLQQSKRTHVMKMNYRKKCQSQTNTRTEDIIRIDVVQIERTRLVLGSSGRHLDKFLALEWNSNLFQSLI